MREDNYENRKELESITNELWEGVNILRGVLPANHYHVYLFLLSGYCDNTLRKELFNSVTDYTEVVLKAFNSTPKYSELLDVYLPIIKNIPERELENLFTRFAFFNFNKLGNNFAQVFDVLLFKLADIQGKNSSEFLLPNEISQLVMDLVDVPKNAKVFNPFSGLASFATHLKMNVSYIGQEIDITTWALGKLRLIIQRRSNGIYYCGDSINEWPIEDRFDLVVANPPFNMKINKYLTDYDFNRTIMTAEQYVLKKGLESINHDGKVVCVASQSTLFKGGAERRYRKQLIENGQIDTIISLPSGLLKHTGVAICIIFLTKKRNKENLIRLIDGESFLVKGERRVKRFDNNKLLNYVKSIENNEFVKYINTKEVLENDYNLSVQRYFANEFEGVELGEISRVLNGEKIKDLNEGTFIGTNNLKEEFDFESKIDFHQVVLNDNRLKTSRSISESCILVSRQWRVLKPSHFEYENTPIYIGREIVALKVDENLINIEYLINELKSESVHKQLNLFKNKGAVNSLDVIDLLKIKVNVLPIGEQQAKVRGILELSQKLKALQSERNALAHGQRIKSFDEFASLKHSLGAPRQNILSNAKSLIRFFEINNSSGFEEVKKLYSERYETNLIDDLIQIKEDINHISTILIKGEKGLILNNYNLTPISINDINKLLKKAKKKEDKFYPQFIELKNEEMKGKGIQSNITLFQILLDNIFSNANKYAFIDASYKNEVIIELKVTDDNMQLEIKNNGIPFPKNYNKEKFIAKFSTANPLKGKGLGGYDINRIAEYFKNPDWDLDLNENSLFPASFKFAFPLITQINE